MVDLIIRDTYANAHRPPTMQSEPSDRQATATVFSFMGQQHEGPIVFTCNVIRTLSCFVILIASAIFTARQETSAPHPQGAIGLLGIPAPFVSRIYQASGSDLTVSTVLRLRSSYFGHSVSCATERSNCETPERSSSLKLDCICLSRHLAARNGQSTALGCLRGALVLDLLRFPHSCGSRHPPGHPSPLRTPGSFSQSSWFVCLL